MTSGPYQLKGDRHSSHALILSRLGEGRGRRLLDVGAADGFLAELLTERGWDVTALEGDPELADRARTRCRHVVVADLERTVPRLTGPFDAIVYGDILEHLSDPLAALLALNRSATPRATVIVSLPNVAHVWVRLSLLVGRFNYGFRFYAVAFIALADDEPHLAPTPHGHDDPTPDGHTRDKRVGYRVGEGLEERERDGDGD